jgi:hypothetical protein
MNTKTATPFFAFIVSIALSSVAHGQDLGGGVSFVPPYWGYAHPSIYSTSSVPYFSLHPPVYYSYRVARTYGYSPFAYPPGVLTPSRETSRPTQSNIDTSSEMMESSEGHQPLRIDNPFIEQPNRPGVTRQKRPAGRQPQVVYPAALAQQGR